MGETNGESHGPVTGLLKQWRDGAPDALDQLYQPLHAVASGYMRREREEYFLQATALVSEVFLRLLKQRRISCSDRGHFLTFAALMMRNILKDHARSRLADRRGGKDKLQMPLSEELAWVDASLEGILDLHAALERMSKLDPPKARL